LSPGALAGIISSVLGGVSAIVASYTQSGSAAISANC
jgi:hypothetical protein